MNRLQSWLFSGVLLALLIQLRVAELSDDVAKSIKNGVANKKLFKQDIDRVLNTLKFSLEMNNFNVKRYLGSGVGCVLVEIEDKNFRNNYLAKVVLDINDKYEICNKEMAIEENNQKGISNIPNFKKYITYKGGNYFFSFYSCILILEEAEKDIDDKLLFT